MYRMVQDFQRDWTMEAEMTQNMMAALTNDSLEQSVASDGRSLGFLAWHIVQAIPVIMQQAGLIIDNSDLPHEPPTSAMDIAAGYEHISRAFLDKVLSTWTDETLLEEISMFGYPMTRGQVLHYVIVHQTHHRGQMTVLMRQAGLTVPNTYGPAREGWAAMGMAAMP